MDPLQRPIFVVGTPESGTTYVSRALGELPGLRLLAQRARNVLDRDPELAPAARGHASARLTAADATPAVIQRVRGELARRLPSDAPRFVDGAPRNALRVGFLDAVFPDAAFVYVYREPRATIDAMVAAWRSGDFVTHPDLPGWPGPPWSLLLTEGWRELAGRSVPEIATAQWTAATRALLADLERLSADRWAVVDFESLAQRPQAQLERLAGVVGLDWEPTPDIGAPAGYVSPPGEGAAETLGPLPPSTVGLAEAAHALLARPASGRPTATPDRDAEVGSVHSAEFARVLDDHGVSVLLSTGELGKLVLIRHDGARVNTHFESAQPTHAIAAHRGALALAGPTGVDSYRATDARGRFAPVGHTPVVASAIGAAETGLWIAVEDRVEHVGGADAGWHLPPDGPGGPITGLALADGRPAYVTTDAALIGCQSNERLATGLDEPYAPRLHNGRVWFVERRLGRLWSLDPATGDRELVTELPGVAGGLVLRGSLAFVALSRHADRGWSGVIVVDIKRAVAGPFLRFEGGVSEVSDVALLDFRFPEMTR
jgi:hypothetical protein